MRKVKGAVLLLSVCALLVALGLSSPARATYLEQFNTLPDGWTVNDIDNTGSLYAIPPTWSNTGGNPGGMISGLAGATGRRLNSIFIWSFNTITTGFWGDLTGMALTTDFKIDGTVTGAKDVLAWFFIQDGFNLTDNLYYSKMTWNPNDDTAWTTHTVALTADNFFGSPPENFADTLKNYQFIGIYFGTQMPSDYSEYGVSSAAGATLSIDNFGVQPVPLPPAVLLLGSGLLGLASLRRLRHS